MCAIGTYSDPDIAAATAGTAIITTAIIIKIG